MAIIEFFGGVLADKAVGKLCSLFKTQVIERWSRRRAEEFVRTFCAVVADGRDIESIQFKLDEMMEDDSKSAALFDAYRRVCLSASPTIGPRIIALVTARIVGESRDASPTEERLMAVAELLTDAEFSEAKDWYERYVVKLPKPHGAFYSPGQEDNVASTDLWDGWGGLGCEAWPTWIHHTHDSHNCR